MKERKTDNLQTKYRNSIYEIRILNCSLGKINITSTNSEEKYYIAPQNIIDFIFDIKDEKKIFNMSHMDVSLIGKCIEENSKSILLAKESNNISEEKKMIDKADIIDNDTKNITTYEDLIPQKNISFNKKSFNVFKSFKNKQKSCEISKKLEEDNKIVNNIMNIQK